MENATKVILLILFISQISCKKKTDDLELIKYNLYKNKKNQLFLKLSNKSVRNPNRKSKRKDTIYRNIFYYNYDSIVRLENVLNIQKYRVIIPDTKFSDGKYYYESNFYNPGQRMYQIKLINPQH